MNKIATYVKNKRREAGLTQAEFAIRSGLGLSFIRKLEQGKDKLKLDKVNQALKMFGMEAVPGHIDRSDIATTSKSDHPSSNDATTPTNINGETS